ncbi:hypothetical protein RFI_21854 [Reticulomyxa filosa]|uniref:Uncharacterized protein n=1 Tax=Reticulomyxa filosa TaxID=46433 RepID=X6MQY6_RETFI|nr:hypothetical protein RFI_21854 [Reticulomyxa filosa]|eukprot:ETO15510.1 hypothetical protein RFI_21854 [Reticulomyxa filosa]
MFSMDMKIFNYDNDNNINNIGIIGGNGYTICSGSFDNTIRIWDIETTKQFNVFKGHESFVWSAKYGSYELMNIILSGSSDNSIRLWDIRCGKQIQVFNGHTSSVYSVEYSPFVVKNIYGNSNVICSGSSDNTIRFWDIRSNKNELYMIKGDEKEDGINCLKFSSLKKKVNNNYSVNIDKVFLISIFKIIYFKIWSCLIYFCLHNEKEEQFIYEYFASFRIDFPSKSICTSLHFVN